jgi:hypothetical protein
LEFEVLCCHITTAININLPHTSTTTTSTTTTTTREYDRTTTTAGTEKSVAVTKVRPNDGLAVVWYIFIPFFFVSN